MTAAAENVQVTVARVNGWDQISKYAVDITRRRGGRTIVAPLISKTEQAHLRDDCAEAGLNLIKGPLRPHGDGIHTALTRAEWGIAETGTVVLRSDSEELRIATMLAEIHIVILAEEAIKPDLSAVEAELQAILNADVPSYTAFITGASRTADIERVLAVGVHGPQEMHLLINGMN
jgi:L-lactate dehydrogenase complex protein LldG